ncbi:MAG: Carboxymethylenebutenolidase [Chloroflexi bacterium]|nr:Carboxymethylenebutenolidase [Chloroflexota bacterium]
MWNDLQTGAYEGMIAETTTLRGHNGDTIHAYFARPLGAGPFPGIVQVHHAPGWDEWTREFSRRFTQHGYSVICPDLYCRYAHGTPDDATAAARAAGGAPDNQVVGDLEAGLNFLKSLPTSNGKIGIIGPCSGGRHSYLTAARVPGFAALVDLWGGSVVMAADQLTPARPVSPLDYTKDLSCPILALFGDDDQNPNPAMAAQIEEELKKQGKEYEIHHYAGAGHGFFYYDRPAYRQEQAMDGWAKVFDFFHRHLQS